MEIQVPYGREHIAVDIDEKNVSQIVHPNPVEIGDEKTIVQHALSHPVNSEIFDQFIANAENLLFIVNDATRPTPTAKIINIIYDKIKNKNIKFIVATGIHRAPTDEEYKQIFGAYYEIFKDRIYAHDSKNEGLLFNLGKSKFGTEIKINKMVSAAHKIVIITSVEPHYFAGYTGGRKSIMPGIAGYTTIEQNHKYALSPGAQALALEGNPVHEDMEDIVARLNKEIFSVQIVLDRNQNTYAVTAGNLKSSFNAAVKKANEVFAVKVKEKADIVVSVAPYPMDIDLYQSQKALDNGKLALKDNGILILVSKCRSGAGDENFIRLMSSAGSPNGVMNKISKGYKLGWHKAAKMAEINLWADVWAVTDLPDEVLRSIFIKPFHNLQQAIDKGIKEKGDNAKILFLMEGSVTVPRIL